LRNSPTILNQLPKKTPNTRRNAASPDKCTPMTAY
jgi:hypothetical protein